MKNTGHFLAFNKEWFEKNQRLLLWLLNAPVIKVWFRWVLRIRKEDCSRFVRITNIQPNNFSYGDRYFKKKGKWYVERTTDFRTHPKFGKRIYYAFRPLWWAIHFWDWAIADRFIPAWSYGFLTLTKFPDANPETTTVDGRVSQSGDGTTTSWSSLVTGTGDGAADSTNPITFINHSCGSVTNKFDDCRRAIFLFDTSALTSGATISDAVLSIFGTGKSDGLSSSIVLNVYSSNPASNTALVGSDFSTLGSTAYATGISFAGYSTSAYNDFTLNSTGRAAVSKTGISKFGIRDATYDAANSQPPWVASNSATMACNFAEATGTTNDPKLVVTYTTTATFTLTAAQGSFIYTGYSAAITSVRRMVAALGTYVLTGRNALFSVGHTIVASVGSFVYTGKNAALLLGRKLIAAYGSFTLTGQNATFRTARLLVAASGVISLSWQSIQLRLNGLLAIYANKFTKRNTSYSDKYSNRGSSYEDKYTHL